ncbi:MAG TPA: sigma-54-dependent Fis family transcriptional regulator [Aeromonadales bacterium]|nr:sigma-54-dependent Fis family transcriptional regulator [Aeromonadales bacterium]
MTDPQPIVLIIDDEPDILQLLSITLNRMKLKTVTARDVKEANKRLVEQKYDFCLTDMRLPDGSGLDIIRTIQKGTPDTPVAVLTAHGNMDTAVKALKLGAFDYVSKPIELPKLRELVKSALKLKQNFLPQQNQSKNNLIGSTPEMQQLQETIIKVSRSQAPVAIFGESGTGKELVARLIHQSGPRCDQQFVPVNCGAIPAELMESELFGHIKGSFTGAINDKEGLFQQAEGGTLFLDEVGELPLSLQVKLLRVIQEKSVRPVGGAKEISCNVRILSATHKNLSRLVQEGKFRQDLYYRLNVIELMVPSLRQRIDDIPELVTGLLKKINPEIQISQGAIDLLKEQDFPGNVRELENILERTIALIDGNTIRQQDLVFTNHHSDSNDNDSASLPVARQPEAKITSETAVPKRDGIPLDKFVEEIEKKEIMQALEASRWNKTAAAKLLGMSFRSLRYKLQKFDLE